VGYLLDQIRLNGEKKELLDEVTALAKKYGIATPYTSYLIVPDAPAAVASLGRGAPGNIPASPGGPAWGMLPAGGAGGISGGIGGGFGGAKPPEGVADFARRVQAAPGDGAKNRDAYEDRRLKAGEGRDSPERERLAEAADKKQAFDE